MSASAAWPTRDLVGALSRAGWGVLDGRPMGGARGVLRALVDLLPYGSGEGSASVAQVADLAGLSTKWTRHCLRVLEGMGVIRHQIGHVKHGRPTPGRVMIVKRALVQILRHAQARIDARREQRRGDTRARLDRDGIDTWFPRRKRRNTLSFQVELSSTLPSQGEGTRRAVPAHVTSERTTDMPQQCVHNMPDINACALCRRTLAAKPNMDVRDMYAPPSDAPVVVPRGGWRALVRAAEARQRAESTNTSTDGMESLW